MQASTAPVTFLFTDIEGSTRLWETAPEPMRAALARHDALGLDAVQSHRGRVVKTTGDGIHAVFDDPLDAIAATIALQQALADPAATAGVTLRVRCGLHVGVDERRDGDFYGRAVNRAARIMSAAHGGQVLVSEAVAVLVRERLSAGIALRDLGQVRLRDLASPEQIFQVVHPALRGSFPALRSLEATPNNLPQQVTSFIGRERELKDVKQLLSGTRLLTLVGPGGIGKTRLSLQAAADVLDDYPDGVWLVELAPLTNPRLVDQAVAIVLGVKEEAGHSVADALMSYVKGKRLLLVLDNCEHLIDASAALAKQVLQSGPGLRILASSREPLRVAGETHYAVPALATPEPGRAVTTESIGQYAAANLFGDRAAAAQPAFRINDRNAVAVADICHRLDGIPLAIELAAARVRSLPVETIAARLGDRFRLLAGGDRTALPRQQTLRALIDWSYELLVEPERELFRRLAVFAGSWTLEAAEWVGAGGDLDEKDVLSLLTRLVEKSLVTMDAEGGRYRFLESVRQYAQEKLSESGEEGAARSRHLAFLHGLAEKANAALEGPHQGTLLARLDLEGENILTAHSWCDCAEGGGELGLRLVHAVKLYMAYRGLLALLHRAALEALARPGAQLRTLARCRALHAAGQASFFIGQYGEAQEFLEDSLAIAQEIQDTARAAMVLEELSSVATGQGAIARARDYMKQALVLAGEQDNKRVLASVTTRLGQLCQMEGDLVTAARCHEQVMGLARELGDRETIAIALLNLAMVAIGRRSDDRARAMLQEALAIAAEIGSKLAGQSALDVAAQLAALRHDWQRAARCFGAAEAQTAQTGLKRDPADDAFLRPLVEQAREALGASAFDAAKTAGHALGYEEAMTEVRAWLEGRH
jgi:predicted ATPase/class 3 adenylate cyclase